MSYMKFALELASKALGSSSTNPAVGAVLVKDGEVVGQGFTQPPGGDHAEVVALRQAGEKARGSTLYVTLEPCCHHGRTPPCTKAIIAAGVAEVHMSLIDPNPLVCGGGRRDLESAGIAVFEGAEASQARKLNEAYFKSITTGVPFVTAKFAVSLDGKIATAEGESRWITGEEARRHAHRLRSISDAIMVGVNTVIRDDPLLTARDERDLPLGKQPLRVVVDSSGRTPLQAKVIRGSGETLVAVSSAAPAATSALRAVGAQVVALPGRKGQVDLTALLKVLGQREVASLLVEGGGTLLGSLFDLGLVDKVVAFIAPLIIGGQGAPTPVGGSGAPHLDQALRLKDVKVDVVGEDVMITGYTRAAPDK